MCIRDRLKENNIPWRDILSDKVNRAYFEARAYLGKGDLERVEKSMAAHAALKDDVEKNKAGLVNQIYDCLLYTSRCV